MKVVSTAVEEQRLKVTLEGLHEELDSAQAKKAAAQAGEELGYSTCSVGPAGGIYQARPDGSPCVTEEDFRKAQQSSLLAGGRMVFRRDFWVVPSATFGQVTRALP